MSGLIGRARGLGGEPVQPGRRASLAEGLVRGRGFVSGACSADEQASRRHVCGKLLMGASNPLARAR